MMEPQVLPFINPATGERFGQVSMATPETVAQAMHEMRQAFPIWSAKPVKERIRVLRKFQALLMDARDEITSCITRDCGKSRQDALIELFMTVDMLAQSCKNARTGSSAGASRPACIFSNSVMWNIARTGWWL